MSSRILYNLIRLTSVTLLLVFGLAVSVANAQNTQINYQGKITDNTGSAVADGDYDVTFALYTVPSGGSAVWTEARTGGNQVTVTNGLFSVMLGEVATLSGVDFTETLYLGVNFDSDGEMTPRKVLGTVPAAFESLNTATFDGLATSSFLRADQADTATGLLTFSGGLISSASSTITELTTGTTTVTTLVVNGEAFTDITGSGLTNNSGILTVNPDDFSGAFASTTDFDTSAELANILTDETGTGLVVFSSALDDYLPLDGSSDMTDTLFLAQGALGTGGISFTGDTDTGIFRTFADGITIQNGGTNVLSTTPTSVSLLDELAVGSGFVSANTQFRVGNPSSATNTAFAVEGVDTGIFSAGTDNLAFSTGGTERMNIDASGNIGIGTTTQGTALVVVGGFSAPGSLGSNTEVLGLGASLSGSVGNDNTLLGANSSLTAGVNGENVIIGANSSSTAGGGRSTLVGANTFNSGSRSVVIGQGLVNSADDAVVIGSGASASGDSLLSIGVNAVADEADSIAFGWGVNTASPAEIVFGSRANATVTPSIRLMGSTNQFTGRDLFSVTTDWLDDTDGSRRGQVVFNAFDTVARPFLQANTSGTDVTTAFMGGSVGIGTSTPSDALTVLGDSSVDNGRLSVATRDLSGIGSLSDGGAAELNGPQGLAVSGDYAFVPTIVDDGVQVIDISDPTNPTAVGNINDGENGATVLNGADRIVIVGNYAYVTALGTDDGLQILDISDPTNIAGVGSIVDGGGGADTLNAPRDLAVVGNYAYVTSGSDNGLQIIDISDPTNPIAAGSITDGNNGADTLSNPQDIVVVGRYAYVVSQGDSGLQIIDISDPNNPVGVGSVTDGNGGTDTLNFAESLAISGNLAFVTSIVDTGIQIIDISDPTNPVGVGSITNSDASIDILSDPKDIVVSGDYAYVISGSGDALQIVDISDPTNPVGVRSVTDGSNGIAELEDPRQMVIVGNNMYVVGGFGDGFQVIDLGGFSAPSADIGSLFAGEVKTNVVRGQSGLFATGVNVGGNSQINGVLSITGTADSSLQPGNTNTALSVISGYVGIGTTTPSSLLTVAGDMYISGAILDSSNASGTSGMVLQTTGTGTQWVATSTLGIGGASASFGADNQIPFTNAGGTDFDYSSGLTYDGSTFSVTGGAIITGQLRLGSGSASSPSYSFGDEADTGFFSYGSNGVAFASNGVEQIRITGSTIQSQTSNSFQLSGGSSAASPTYRFESDDDTGMFRSGTDALGFATAGNERLTIDATGNIGIGTTTPGEVLSVVGNAEVNGQLILESGSLANPAITGTGSNSDEGIYFRDSSSLAFVVSGFDRIRIDGNGLFVPDSNGPLFRNTAATSPALVPNRSNTNAGIGANTAGNVSIFANNSGATEMLRLTGTESAFINGNVGVGTTSPYATFSVDGDIAFTGGIYDSTASLGTNGMVLQTDGTNATWVATSSLGIAGGSISPDSLDFSDFSDSMTVDADTDIDVQTNRIRFQGGSATATFDTSISLVDANFSLDGVSGLQLAEGDIDVDDGFLDVAGNVSAGATGGYIARFINDGNDTNRLGLLIRAGADDSFSGDGGTLIQMQDGDGTNVGFASSGFNEFQFGSDTGVSAFGLFAGASRQMTFNDGADADFNVGFEMTGTTNNIELGSNFLSGDGNDEGISIDSSGNVDFSRAITGGTANSFAINQFGVFSGDADGDPDAPNFTFTGDTDTGLYSPGAGLVGLTTNGVSGLLVDASGNVGIGTTTPSETLHIYSDNSILRLTDSSAVSSQYISGIDFDWESGQLGFVGIDNVTRNPGNLGLVVAAERFGEGIIFQTGGNNERMRIDGNGNLGIGTSSPNSILSVRDTTPTISIIDDDATVELDQIIGNLAFFSEDPTSSLGVTDERASIKAVSEISFGSNTGMAFYTRDGVIYDERMRLTNEGYLGLATTTPTAQLTISPLGSAGVEAGILIERFDNDGGGDYAFRVLDENSGNAVFDLFSPGGGTQEINMFLDGNFGIGSSTPSEALTVSGTAYIDGTLTMAGSAANIALGDNFLSGDGTDEGIFIDAAGRVGIGTSTLTSRQLLVDGDIQANGAVYGSGDETSPALSFQGDADTGFFRVSTNQFGISSGGTEYVRFNSANMQSRTSGAWLLDFDGTSAANPAYGFLSDTDTGMFRSTANTLGFATAGVENLRIDSTGQVGISTTTITQTLTVAGDIRVGTSGTNGCLEDFAGTAISGSCSSDRELKTDIVSITDTASSSESFIERLAELEIVTYRWNQTAGSIYSKNTEIENLGVIAQDVEALFPELVTFDDEGYRQVDFRAFPFYIIEALREVWQTVTGNKEKIESLEDRIEALEAQLGVEPATTPDPEPVAEEEGDTADGEANAPEVAEEEDQTVDEDPQTATSTESTTGTTTTPVSDEQAGSEEVTEDEDQTISEQSTDEVTEDQSDEAEVIESESEEAEEVVEEPAAAEESVAGGEGV